MHTTSWALNIANRRLLAQLLLLLFSSSLSFLALLTKFALGRATASRIREVFRQTGEAPVIFLLAAQTVRQCCCLGHQTHLQTPSTTCQLPLCQTQLCNCNRRLAENCTKLKHPHWGPAIRARLAQNAAGDRWSPACVAPPFPTLPAEQGPPPSSGTLIQHPSTHNFIPCPSQSHSSPPILHHSIVYVVLMRRPR